MTSNNKVEDIKRRFEYLKRKKQPFNESFGLIARYIEMKDIQFSNEGMSNASPLIPEEIQNNIVHHISRKASSTLLGELWPNGASSFRIVPHRTLSDTKEIRDYFKNTINKQLYIEMDNPRNGLELALEEAVGEYVDYGTGSVGVFENDSFTSPAKFRSWDIKESFIDENADKVIDTNYCVKEMNILSLVKKYGEEKVSAQSRKAFDDKRYDEKVKVLIAIEPNTNANPNLSGVRGMPFIHKHIELETGKILLDSGFAEYPIPTARMYKRLGEVWGRGAGLHSIPSVIMLNVMWESIVIAYEKLLDQPLALLDDGRLGADSIDTSAGALNVLSVNSRIMGGEQIIFPIGNVTEPQGVAMLIQQLSTDISNHYLIDKLLDLNNQNEMTFGEANIRKSFRDSSLVSVYRRLMTELFVPLIDRTINILLRAGRMGAAQGSEKEIELVSQGISVAYIPQEILVNMIYGRDWYEIEFISPAARYMQREEANGIKELFALAGTLGVESIGPILNFDVDAMVRKLATLLGVSIDVLNSTEAVQTTRQAVAQQQQRQQQIAEAREVSEIKRNEAQAQATINSGYLK